MFSSKMTYWRMQRNHWKTSRKHRYERWTSNFHIYEKVTFLVAKSAVFIAHTNIISRSAKCTKLASLQPLLLKLSSENQILLDFWRLQSLLFTVFLERKHCFSTNLIELEREARNVNSFKNIANVFKTMEIE